MNTIDKERKRVDITDLLDKGEGVRAIEELSDGNDAPAKKILLLLLNFLPEALHKKIWRLFDDYSDLYIDAYEIKQAKSESIII